MIIFLDYDGTLTPIVKEPDEAKIEADRKKFLEELSKKHRVVIVTGRSIESFKKVFGHVPDTIYVITSHGAKIYRDEKLLKEFLDLGLPDLTPLRERIKNIPGVFIEEKEGCFALHFRNFKGDESRVKGIFKEFVDSHPPKKVIEGKKVLEAVYSDVDKGKAVENFLRLVGWNGKEKVVYIGDDTTDLYALKKVRELGGLPVFVGKDKPPEAEFTLENVDQVYVFLSRLEKFAGYK
ncbi:trehalose 6-phosphatase [Hydrogenivirga caldilitoris]|uniref:Trehalose 6-phosphate phosphatase n=1 Tax=Hydrogenivirga caldilitoris TaxID=246264 RepID=A0A497XQ42_9AQUI|nr:trehalose-phosphatase [Hydrogenivirga caldilitoris]RLJ70270.1 trehalose 6-phosphatase [Hydrogenivirga caldilitoris]